MVCNLMERMLGRNGARNVPGNVPEGSRLECQSTDEGEQSTEFLWGLAVAISNGRGLVVLRLSLNCSYMVVR